MSGEALMHWLSHLGEGTWARFQGAVSGILSPDDDVKRMLQFWRQRLSDLGHVDFFVNGSQRWCVRQTVLAGLCGFERRAALCGARSPIIVQSLEVAADKYGCRVEVDTLPSLPSRVVIVGDDEQLERVARECKLNYIPQYAEKLCLELKPVAAASEAVSDEPAKWHVRSFDLESRSWVAGRLPKAAREYQSNYGERCYFWCDWQNKLRPASKREAVYASAAVQRVTLTTYDRGQCSLAVTAASPLPADYMRVACLCSGKPPRYEGGTLILESVPLAVASILLVSAGQPHPGVSVPRSEGFKENLEVYG
jgi:hypothetical protein